MPLTIGSRIGSYEIILPIGAGGMGEVYRARDTKLNRDVALKVLPDAVSLDPDRLARFKREAQVLASLNHPNIAAIYGFEDSGSVHALVLELVEGPTLAEKLAGSGLSATGSGYGQSQKPKAQSLSIEEALNIARQIAEAFEAAHDQSIIHRDLKPANVKVRDDGKVKVLDFGLAKMMGVGEVEAAGALVTQSPTITTPAMTQAGFILGTAAYMSPEQARGKAADKRSDIWAFGCVLFEMLTGQRPFHGDDVSTTLAAVLKDEPNWSRLPESTPESIRQLLRRCLAKDPNRRLHHIADGRLEIEDALHAPAAPPLSTPVAVQRQRPLVRVVPWVITAAAVGLAVAAWLVTRPRAGAGGSAPTVKLEMSTPDGVEITGGVNRVLDLSPDGMKLAFVGIHAGLRKVYLRSLDATETRALDGTEGAIGCFFAPDGRSLYVITNGSLVKKVSLGDGLISTAASGVFTLLGAAAVQGAGLIFLDVANGTLQLQADGNPRPRALTTTAVGGDPVALPGGKAILFTATTPTTSSVDALVLETGERKHILDEAANPVYGERFLAFMRGSELLAVPFDVNRLMASGTAVRLSERLSPAGSMAASRSGTLAYVMPASSTGQRLVWVSREGLERPAPDAREYLSVRVSPNGRYLAMALTGGIWLEDLSRGTAVPLRGAVNGTAYLEWADSERLVFWSGGPTRWVNVVTGASGLVAETMAADFVSSVSADGKTILFQHIAGPSVDVYSAPFEEHAVLKPLINTSAFEGGARISPDGKWIAYVSDETGKAQVHLRAFQGSDRAWPVSTAGGSQPVWNRDGRELFYRDEDKMMRVAISGTSEPTISAPTMLFEQRYAFGNSIGIANYDFFGDRFVMIKGGTEQGRINIVLNWFREVNEAMNPRR
jgi:tRNA A-37 threonylcarbamoyl transferase component Bud32